MKKLITIICAILILTGCAIQKNPKREYYSINELRSFGLSKDECRAIQNDKSIESFYHCGKDERLYKYIGK